MTLIKEGDAHANWSEVLLLWNRIANWIHYHPSEAELRQQLKSMLIFLWNEKDWLKNEYPTKAKQIEQIIEASKHLRVVGDLANTLKHRKLRKRFRSQAVVTDYFGKVTVSGAAERRVYYVSLGNGEHHDVMEVLRGALEEFEKLRFSLLSGTI